MKESAQRRREATPTMDVIEEAIALLRRAPASAHLTYYLGAVPFWIGMLYFLSDMSQNALAEGHILDTSLGVALLYLWKKTWQVVSTGQLRGVLTGCPDEVWTARRVWRTLAAQAFLQPVGLILRPIAAALTLPVVWVSVFFQNVTILGDGTEQCRTALSRALEQSKLWPLQAHGLVSILTLFSFFVWLNLFIALAAGPYLLKMFFGVETAYTRSFAASLNTTFLTATVALTSLAVDPLRKAVFAIRCFHGISLYTGEDIAAELRQIRSRQAPALASLATAMLLVMATPVTRAEPDRPVERLPAEAKAGELERHIGTVLERREYTWRAPRVKESDASNQSWIGRWLSGIGRKLGQTIDAALTQAGRVVRWIRGLFTTPAVGSGTSVDWLGLAKALLALTGAALVGVIVWFILKWIRTRKAPGARPTAAMPIVPDLRAENLVADQLPEDGWRELARDHAARGDLVLALRAAWLAGLAHLGRREFIAIARYKSNRDYDRELRRRARDREQLLAAFDVNLRAFERSWYGKHGVSDESYHQFEENLDRIRTS